MTSGIWLQRFAGARPINTAGALHFYACEEQREPRLVIAAAANSPREQAAARLDGLANGHRLVRHPLVPRLVERGAVGEIEFASFACDAVADYESLLRWLEDRGTPIDVACNAALIVEGSAAVAAAHATIDPADGRPICLGVIAMGHCLFNARGDLWLIGFGDRFAGRQMLRDSGVFVAPEVARGQDPTPKSDIYGLIMAAERVNQTIAAPAAVDRILTGRDTEADRQLKDTLSQVQGRLLSGNMDDRPGSVEELMQLGHMLWAMMGVAPDRERLRRLMIEYLAFRHSADDVAAETVPALPSWQRGRYRAERVLGEGAMGRVYLALDRELGQPVAIKTLTSPHRNAQERFIREVKLLRRLRHPHVVAGFDVLQDSGGLAAVMEYIAGEPLSEHLSRGVPAPQAVGWCASIAAALGCLHEAGIVHRDVKPANVIIHPERGPVLVDLGVAAIEDSELTASGAIIGTPAYAAPEQLTGRGAEPASDVYALALVLIEALRGERPFGGASTIQQAIAMRLEGSAPLLDARVPAALQPLLARALALHADARPAAAELALKLRSLG